MKYWITIVFLLISNKIISAESDSVFRALALIEKQIFISQDGNKINELLFEKSNVQIENNHSNEAIRTLERVDTILLKEEEKAFYFYKLSIAQILSEQFDQAQEELEKIKPKNDSVKKEMEFLAIFIQNEMENFDECKSGLLSERVRLNCISKTDSLLPTKIDRKNSAKASRLSAFFPGAGQCYAGKFGKGLLSFTLTASFATFGVYNFVNGYYGMSVVSGLFPALKFYAGGKRLAENLVEKQNLKHTTELKQLYRSRIYDLHRCN